MIKTILNFFKPTPLSKTPHSALTTIEVCPSKLKKGQVLNDGCQVVGMSKQTIANKKQQQ